MQISMILCVDQNEAGGGVHMSAWHYSLIIYLSSATFKECQIGNAKQAAFHWQCSRGNMNNAEQKESWHVQCYRSKLTILINTEPLATYIVLPLA